jgi:PAS domain S-box-containing protein
MDYAAKSEFELLRKKAEAILKDKTQKSNSALTEAELLRAVHEMEVFQIELELQNEELKLARERSEVIAQKYTSLYDFAPIGYFTLSEEGKILDLNLIGAKMLGKDRSFLKGNSFGRFIPEKGLPTFNLFLEKAFKSKTKEVSEMLVMGCDDQSICAQLTAIVEEEHDDHCLLTILDITERKNAESELEEVVKQLNLLNSQKDMFFSIIAHDLKNPFTAIIGHSELMMMEVQSKDYESVEEIAGVILNSSKRAMDLLFNLMEWSKSQTGRHSFNPTPFLLKDVVSEVFALFDQIAIQKHIRIEMDISGEIKISADRNMIATILRNLVSNAVKFANPGGEIKVYTVSEGGSLSVCVKDNGVGMSEEELKKLFSADTPITSLGTNNEKGTGLGLILCKEFVEKHGGKIWAESEKDKGSTFYVSLPG